MTSKGGSAMVVALLMLDDGSTTGRDGGQDTQGAGARLLTC
jgi:hypothetical protein